VLTSYRILAVEDLVVNLLIHPSNVRCVERIIAENANLLDYQRWLGFIARAA
jgi:hypothetical protein